MLIFLGKLTKSEKSVVFDFANYLTDAKDEFEQNLSFIYAILRDCSVINASLGEKNIIGFNLINQVKELLDDCKIYDLYKKIDVVDGEAEFKLINGG